MWFGIDEVKVVLKGFAHFLVVFSEDLAEAVGHTPGESNRLHTLKAEAGLFNQRHIRHFIEIFFCNLVFRCHRNNPPLPALP